MNINIKSKLFSVLMLSVLLLPLPSEAVISNKQLLKAVQNNNVNYISRQLDAGLKASYGIKGETLLMIAAREGHLDIVELLTSRGADVNAKSPKGHNAMSYSSRYGHLPVVQYLLNHGAEVNITNNNKWTPLLKAARGGHLEVVDYLLAHDADINSHNSGGLDAVALARRYGHKKVVKYLRKYKRDYK